MAVQILNDMPDAEVHRGEPIGWIHARIQPQRRSTGLVELLTSRAGFMGITALVHVVAVVIFVRAQAVTPPAHDATPIEASIIEMPMAADEPPPRYEPPPASLVYDLRVPQVVSFETESITLPDATPATADAAPTSVAPPLVESVDYVRTVPPVYPRESQRRREYGTVLLRVLVDEQGRPARVQVERSSGYQRLDVAARTAVEKFLFRPHEVNGVARTAQVLIPIGFDKPAS
jgi:protein TonB